MTSKVLVGHSIDEVAAVDNISLVIKKRIVVFIYRLLPAQCATIAVAHSVTALEYAEAGGIWIQDPIIEILHRTGVFIGGDIREFAIGISVEATAPDCTIKLEAQTRNTERTNLI